jgi:hypothetical protein
VLELHIEQIALNLAPKPTTWTHIYVWSLLSPGLPDRFSTIRLLHEGGTDLILDSQRSPGSAGHKTPRSPHHKVARILEKGANRRPNLRSEHHGHR